MSPPISSLFGQNHDWIERTLDLCVNRYVGSDGLLVTALTSEGAIVDPTPLVADFGDVLPFLAHFGRRDFVEQQIKAARPHLSHSLFRNRGRIRLFENHDWLLGLLELYELTGDPSLLALARDGASTLIKTMFVDDFLVDGTIEWRDARTWLRPASPFNGGYIELWLELSAATGDTSFVQASRRLAARWVETDDFRETGIFHRVPCSYSSAASHLAGYATTSRARLFKDNTNFVWGLLSLWQATREERWRQAITNWLRGFRSLFLNEGDVFLWLDRQRDGRDVSLKAAFSSIDLLCDLHLGGVQEGALELATIIARRWATRQWTNGLFPETPDGERDHLDANVDMAIALLKLGGLTGKSDYVDQARTTARAVIRHHSSPLGLVQAVGKDGNIEDRRIIVKYQGLALKLAIAPDSPATLFSDPALLKLLRDR